ncbi:hypothetical protein B0H14DRAFT_3011289, partial [Mycena olivaceomarginata]
MSFQGLCILLQRSRILQALSAVSQVGSANRLSMTANISWTQSDPHCWQSRLQHHVVRRYLTHHSVCSVCNFGMVLTKIPNVLCDPAKQDRFDYLSRHIRAHSLGSLESSLDNLLHHKARLSAAFTAKVSLPRTVSHSKRHECIAPPS